MASKKKTYQVHNKEKKDIVVKIDQLTGLRAPIKPTKIEKDKKKYSRKVKHKKSWN